MQAMNLNTQCFTTVQPATYLLDQKQSFKDFLNNKSVPLSIRIDRLARLLKLSSKNLISIFKASKASSPIQVYIKYKEGNELEPTEYGAGVTGDCLQYIGYIKKSKGRFLLADNLNGIFGHDLIFTNIEVVEILL